MATSDGISTADWEVVHDLALKIANAEAESDTNVYKKQLMLYLDELEAKYGVLPSILATRADYVEDRAEAGALLRQAYTIAAAARDTLNMKEIAESLKELQLEDSDGGQDSTTLISQQLADEVGNLLTRMNRGYWTVLTWDLLSDGAEFVVIAHIDEQGHTRENMRIVCAILRTVMATLLPSSPKGLTWVGSVMFQGKPVASVCGGLGEDWRTCGTHGGLDEEVLWEE